MNSTIFAPHTPKLLLVDTLYDYRVGGTRFEVSTVGLPESIWGKVYLPYEAKVGACFRADVPAL